jgi:hypothetical protein
MESGTERIPGYRYHLEEGLIGDQAHFLTANGSGRRRRRSKSRKCWSFHFFLRAHCVELEFASSTRRPESAIILVGDRMSSIGNGRPFGKVGGRCDFPLSRSRKTWGPEKKGGSCHSNCVRSPEGNGPECTRSDIHREEATRDRCFPPRRRGVLSIEPFRYGASMKFGDSVFSGIPFYRLRRFSGGNFRRGCIQEEEFLACEPMPSTP